MLMPNIEEVAVDKDSEYHVELSAHKSTIKVESSFNMPGRTGTMSMSLVF